MIASDIFKRWCISKPFLFPSRNFLAPPLQPTANSSQLKASAFTQLLCVRNLPCLLYIPESIRKSCPHCLQNPSGICPLLFSAALSPSPVQSNPVSCLSDARINSSTVYHLHPNLPPSRYSRQLPHTVISMEIS